jgi:2-oxoglutarate dehydrogenase E2 component (dihydrolipoamide succinyltransferase)
MPVDIKVPPMGESVADATVARWLKQVGETVQAGEPVVSLETDKVDLDVPAGETGVLTERVVEEGATVVVGDVLARIEPGEAPEVSPSPSGETTEAAAEAATVRATPLARKVAEAADVDLGAVAGSGPAGQVRKDDVATYLERKPAPAPPPAEGAAGRAEERIRMSRRRQTIAHRLVEAQHTAAMLTTFNEADMSAVMAIRKRRREAFQEKHGVGLGLMSFFTKAVVAALRDFPHLNAEIQGDEIVLKRYYDIGLAVSTDEGLVVPVLRDADRKSFAEIERDVAELAARAREGRLTLEELRGGTFTITNGGIFGSLLSTPILNTPQVGILGMHRIQERPVAVDGQVVIRPMMYLALSYDHRIVDGSTSVRFLVRVKELIEDPALLLIDA